jgi:hypothetical protein
MRFMHLSQNVMIRHCGAKLSLLALVLAESCSLQTMKPENLEYGLRCQLVARKGWLHMQSLCHLITRDIQKYQMPS